MIDERLNRLLKQNMFQAAKPIFYIHFQSTENQIQTGLFYSGGMKSSNNYKHGMDTMLTLITVMRGAFRRACKNVEKNDAVPLQGCINKSLVTRARLFLTSIRGGTKISVYYLYATKIRTDPKSARKRV